MESIGDNMEPNIPEDACAFIENLTLISPPPSAIWLIGSYANNREKSDSDVDLLVFGSEAFLSALQQRVSKPHKIDCLVVFNEVDFRDPWQDKRGSLKKWQWSLDSERVSTYKGISFTEGNDEDGAYIVKRTEHAILIWPPCPHL